MAALTMDRAQHLSWVKKRALRYVERGDLAGALVGLTADMARHPELADHPALREITLKAIRGDLHTQEQVRQFIDGIR